MMCGVEPVAGRVSEGTPRFRWYIPTDLIEVLGIRGANEGASQAVTESQNVTNIGIVYRPNSNL